MKIGVLWSSHKENEKRYPLVRKHIIQLKPEELEQLYFEEGYPNLEFSDQAFNFLPRQDVFEKCDLVILPKPDRQDYPYLKENQILWGWPHTVQGVEIANIAIEKKLTLIAWENMYVWSNNSKKEHIFCRNNELAGYAAVNHFMELVGITPGVYGENIKIAVIGYGSTARGAINALIGLGGTNITVYSKRNRFQISDAIKNINYQTYEVVDGRVLINNEPAHKTLINYDLIVNCVLQNPNNPLFFLKECEIDNGKKMIIDISCDKGMGFDFAKPTTFDMPLIDTTKYIYYAVDHTPSYFWNSASYEISGALFPFLKYVLANQTYLGNTVLEKAVDIQNGVIINSAIIAFQKRETEYPYRKK